VGSLQKRVAQAIVRDVESGTADASMDLASDHELQVFLSQHEQASIELVADVAARLEGGTKIASTIRSPYPSLRPHVTERLTVHLAEFVDQLAVGLRKDENRQIAAVAAQSPRSVELGMMITRGLRFPGLPAPVSGAGDLLAEQLAEAVDLDVSEVGLYNYGLLPESEVTHFMTAVREAAGQR
jgi:hypothetical protein